MRLYSVEQGRDAACADHGRCGCVSLTAYHEQLVAGETEWLIRPRGPAVLHRSAELRLSAGSRYLLAADQRHQVVPDGDRLSVTVFLETATVRSGTDVYTRPDRPPPRRRTKQQLGLADYARELRRLAEWIN